MFSTILTYEFVSFFFELAHLACPPKTSAYLVFFWSRPEPRLDLGSDDEEARQQFASGFPVFNQLPWEPKTLIFSGYFTHIF